MSANKPEQDQANEIARLYEKLAEREGEIVELKATIYMMNRDSEILGPENLRLQNLANLRGEQLRQLRQPKRVGRQPQANGYDRYLWRTTRQLLDENQGKRQQDAAAKKLSERAAAIQADGLIRKQDEALRAAGLEGLPFPMSNHATGDSIAAAWKRAKVKYEPPKVVRKLLN